MLLEPRQTEKIRHRSEGNYELVIRQLMAMARFTVNDADRTAFQRNGFDLGTNEVNSRQEGSDRAHNRRNLQVAGGDFMKHRREEEEVLAIHERNFDAAGPRQALLKVERRVQPREAAPEDQYSPVASRVCLHGPAPMDDIRERKCSRSAIWSRWLSFLGRSWRNRGRIGRKPTCGDLPLPPRMPLRRRRRPSRRPHRRVQTAAHSARRASTQWHMHRHSQDTGAWLRRAPFHRQRRALCN